MEEIIKTFHLDIKLIIAQLFNVAIVMYVLHKYAYKPLLTKLNERTSTIEKGLADAKKAQDELANAEKTREERINEAKKEAWVILEEAQKVADKNKQETVDKARIEAQKVIEEAKTQIMAEKEKMIREVKQEIGQLVVAATEKIMDEKMDESRDKVLIDKTLADVK